MPRLPGVLPRFVAWVGIPLAAVLLTGLFILIGFPYDLLGARAAHALRDQTGVDLRFDALHPTLQWAGPAFEAEGVDAVLPDGTRVSLERALLRPAWSLAWFRGDPAIHTEVESPFGSIDGVVYGGDRRGFAGELSEVALDRLPLDNFLEGFELAGLLEAEVDVLMDAQGLRGTVVFELADGRLQPPGLPLALPVDALRGDVRLGGEVTARVDSLELLGPMLSGTLQGVVGRGPRVHLWPLDLEAELKSVNPTIRATLAQMGFDLPRNGQRFRVRGSPTNPIVETP
ncbi:MAG: type II secretion system protein GspN [Proteobacteria bacterium]|nr:type II secretion system protein GspN [Pseudomonadota bacterium]